VASASAEALGSASSGKCEAGSGEIRHDATTMVAGGVGVLAAVAGGVGACGMQGEREATGAHGDCALWRLTGGPRPFRI
jgi:hypothetical protein